MCVTRPLRVTPIAPAFRDASALAIAQAARMSTGLLRTYRSTTTTAISIAATKCYQLL